MAQTKQRRDLIPESFASIEEAAEFWDSHSTSDYEDLMREVDLQVDIGDRTFLVPIEGRLADDMKSWAERQGVGLETLVNLWLREKCAEAARAPGVALQPAR